MYEHAFKTEIFENMPYLMFTSARFDMIIIN